MKLYANLHTHSTNSDGGYTPKQVAWAAKKEGYGAVALTDHDTVTGYPELRAECEKLGLETIFGAEFSSPSKMLEENKDKGPAFHLLTEFHICGYHFNPEYPPMKKYLEGMSFRETEQTRTLFERGVRLGKIKGIEWEEVLEFNKGVTWLCNDHLFRAMLAKGVITRADRGWYFKELFGIHRKEVPPAYDFLQEYEIIKLIHDAGGIAIVAHPHDQLKYIEPLIEMGIDGLEVWHHLMTDEEKEQALRIAYDNGLYISGGSDHYGLCSGYYENYGSYGDYEEPEKMSCYAPYLSYGTTKEYFDEIKRQKITR